MSARSLTTLLAERPARAIFRDEVVAGLSQPAKRLPCKYFYDRRGSKLFDAICAQPEYYLTRTEQQIMLDNVRHIAHLLGPQITLLEFGSGSSVKTRCLLEQLDGPAVYVPIDISRKHLMGTARHLRRDFAHLTIRPMWADFTAELRLPRAWDAGRRRVVYFPGSTIGNFEPEAALRLLHRIAHLIRPGGGFLVGIDLVKPAEILHRAYNDAAGVTAQFNLNLLRRINRELGTDFDLSAFEHCASYDATFQRMDLRLLSNRRQQVRLADRAFAFQAQEPIHTEYSHKYTIDRFSQLACEAGFKLQHTWTDERSYFGVLYFSHECCHR